MFVKKLKGFSGCDVSLHIDEEKDRKFVRKISSCAEYNSRLKKQMNKQSIFSDEILKTPKIYGAGFDEDKFYFDMEFIRGETFNNFVLTSSTSNILFIFEKIIHFLSNSQTGKRDFTDAVEKKINSLKIKIDPIFHKHLDYCLKCDWTRTMSSVSHGDLTFENIVIYKSDVYLIDFLDSFVETKYIDYSKILQDIILGWSWRNSNSPPPFIKCMLLYSRICENLNSHEREITKRLLVLNILRIIPYADKCTLRFLKDRLDYIGGKFEIY